MNELTIMAASERVDETKGITGCIFGKSGIGKTSLLRTLPEDKTLFFDLEAGDLAIEGWQGDVIRPRTWQDCRNLACFIGGADPAHQDDGLYGNQHYHAVCQQFGDPKQLNQYDTIFIDSITVAGRLCFNWCKRQSQVIRERKGKLDLRAAYGLHGQEMVAWLTHLQHTRHKNIWFVGILDEKVDDFHNHFFTPQIEGSKAGLELPGIVDEVITMADIPTDDNPYRAFVCHTLNPYGYPAKDRSGRLQQIEEPHLGKLMQKIKGEKPHQYRNA